MNSSNFLFSVITPYKTYFQKTVQSLSIFTENGQITILPHHIDLITNVDINIMTIIESNHKYRYAVSGGTLSFNHKMNQAILLTDAIEYEKDIDINRAINAKTRALNIISNKENDERDTQIAEIKLKKALNRINLKGGN